MIAWHVAGVTFLFRWIFRDPKVDMRFLAAGAVAPDVIDLTAVTVAGGDSGELWAHSLLLPTALAVAVLLLTRRGRRRRAWMALVVGWLLHLLIDGMWVTAEVFLWPAFGWELPVGSGAFWPEAWERARTDPWRWILEAIGLAYLVWLGWASELGDPERRRRFLSTGRLDR